MAIILVVFLVAFVAIAAAIVSMSTSGARGAGDHVNASRALFMAESGIEWAALELFDSADPESACSDLQNNAALPESVNGEGSFDITDSEYDTADGGCRLTAVGIVNETRRVLKGKIPESVLEGDTGGGDDLFEDTEFNCNSNNVECQDGELIFNRPGGKGQGQPPTQANGADLISDNFVVGDEVYFTANIDWDASPTNNMFGLEMNIDTGANIDCDVPLPGLNSTCSAPAENELYENFDIVLALGDYFASNNVGQVKIRLDWATNPSNQVVLADGCIGRAGYCSGSGDDPVDDGTWDENP
ncbi:MULTISPECIES: hypothetical protein [unclassified Wenzhouxiangella]|uniref:hypothetical protein n=1 Tax=unclassified Wenzhouxiangella TaxID=2613841 RepID=UPI000E32645F|nr:MULTISPECIES: hypothetical protein [unclassified Wenzhouxiangella]RFF28295.1 hypothetical protein DZK25_03345 [Wenzhouxiangella sp. 15181]RFP67780.1 hypothetical protein DZK26_11290 [Wenzhouxiangella sp. 15190]